MVNLATRVSVAFSLVDELLDTWRDGGLNLSCMKLQWKFEHWV